MTPGEMARVLAKCAAYDQRTIGDADVAAWHEAVGDLGYDDALAAVTRHYRTSRDRMWPADLREQVVAIRNARHQDEPHEIRALPSRFEADQIRDQRIRDNVRRLAAGMTVPDDPPDDPHAAAINRAKRERAASGRPAPAPRQRRTGGKPIDTSKLPGPAWATAEAREKTAVAELHRANRPCGRAACPACNATAA